MKVYRQLRKKRKVNSDKNNYAFCILFNIMSSKRKQISKIVRKMAMFAAKMLDQSLRHTTSSLVSVLEMSMLKTSHALVNLSLAKSTKFLKKFILQMEIEIPR